MNKAISFAVFESMQTKDERIIKRLIIALVICIVLLFVSNALWIIAVARYGTGSDTSVSSNGGSANYIGHDGDINNGTNNGKNKAQSAQG